MKPQAVRVEPLSTYMEARQVPVTAATRCGDLVYVSQHPPYGSSLDKVVKCTVYCNDPAHFKTINSIYARYFPTNPPARSLIFVSGWHGPFDVEIDCIAAV
jgi:2-iminobutanoate/2-iminopropanoate deaminase